MDCKHLQLSLSCFLLIVRITNPHTHSYFMLLAICVFQEVVLSHFFQSCNLCGQMVDYFKVKFKVSITSYNFSLGFLLM
jgi:hypothetical protein